ncbi:hypothetical protein GCM10009814_04870 [Lapillicoccus jejuensis]
MTPAVTPPDGIVRVSKLNLSLLVLALTSISAGLYLSPVASPLRQEVQRNLSVPSAASEPRPVSTGSVTGSVVRSRYGAPYAPSVSTSSGRRTTGTRTGGTASSVSALRAPLSSSAFFARGAGYTVTVRTPSTVFTRTVPVPAPGPATPNTTGTPTPSDPAGTTSPTGGTPSSPTTTAPPAKTKCWQFDWQQDAQAVYVANLSDPYGLDGLPGPYDADGLACSDLPVDPNRAASIPVGQYVAPKASAQTKATIVGSTTKYFGFSQDGLPGDTTMFDTVEAAAGKAPSSVGWYESFDDTFRGDLVTNAWRRGALPVMTWMPTDNGQSGNHYSLSTIISGANDDYLRKFAGDVVRTNLQVGIRFGHEMNGGWYPWSAGRKDFNNSPDKFKQAWIHVWQVFQSVGANDNVVWIWSPSRVDNLKPSPTNGITAMADDYPGDQYVDWVGASVYLRRATTGSTYDASFAKTVTALKATTSKPIFFCEVGAIETDGTTDEAGLKTDFIHNTLSAFAADPRIVGFLWNNNIATQVVDGIPISNDWRFVSNPAAQKQFVTDIASDVFRTGMVGLDADTTP